MQSKLKTSKTGRIESIALLCCEMHSSKKGHVIYRPVPIHRLFPKTTTHPLKPDQYPSTYVIIDLSFHSSPSIVVDP